MARKTMENGEHNLELTLLLPRKTEILMPLVLLISFQTSQISTLLRAPCEVCALNTGRNSTVHLPFIRG